MSKLRDSKGRFKEGNDGYWAGKKRPEMYGHTWNKGKIPWNKGLTKETDDRVKKYAENISGHLNCKWKGDDAKYQAIHKWIRGAFEPLDRCEVCGSLRHVQWANRNYKYRRVRKDWMMLCASCHSRYDRANGWGAAIKRFGEGYW